MHQANDVTKALPGRQPSSNFLLLHCMVWNLLIIVALGNISLFYIGKLRLFKFCEKVD